MTEQEILARHGLVTVAQAMLDGELPYLEGAAQVLAIRSQLSGIADRDADFDVFVVIRSETDHLPLEEQRYLWPPEVLARLEPEFKQSEEWARSFAPQACRHLIERFNNTKT
ncbi:DUF2489 domain-containing protein [Paraburkholderia sp. LEh10]|uniref:DUF2489 domain-containing protein n=1 Tax=Paraburkholderia sp. LEh10 TaxID=2821353 RepID=UPI001AE75612|nr:DUF2489 domain-containing protein [Paraburkholderia sp. LEh10]MBP0596373.1 DUF2489 domain-containing protein [Paraburkholderia sp. LEh10]